MPATSVGQHSPGHLATAPASRDARDTSVAPPVVRPITTRREPHPVSLDLTNAASAPEVPVTFLRNNVAIALTPAAAAAPPLPNWERGLGGEGDPEHTLNTLTDASAPVPPSDRSASAAALPPAIKPSADEMRPTAALERMHRPEAGWRPGDSSAVQLVPANPSRPEALPAPPAAEPHAPVHSPAPVVLPPGRRRVRERDADQAGVARMAQPVHELALHGRQPSLPHTSAPSGDSSSPSADVSMPVVPEQPGGLAPSQASSARAEAEVPTVKVAAGIPATPVTPGDLTLSWSETLSPRLEQTPEPARRSRVIIDLSQHDPVVSPNMARAVGQSAPVVRPLAPSGKPAAEQLSPAPMTVLVSSPAVAIASPQQQLPAVHVHATPGGDPAVRSSELPALVPRRLAVLPAATTMLPAQAPEPLVAAPGSARATPQGAAGQATAHAPAETRQPQPQTRTVIDVDDLVDKTLSRLMRRLDIESERKGSRR
jgi:hypothetical protein